MLATSVSCALDAELIGKIGLVYRYDKMVSDYLYVFFPEKAADIYSKAEDPMIRLCFGFYEDELELAEWCLNLIPEIK